MLHQSPTQKGYRKSEKNLLIYAGMARKLSDWQTWQTNSRF